MNLFWEIFTKKIPHEAGFRFLVERTGIEPVILP